MTKRGELLRLHTLHMLIHQIVDTLQDGQFFQNTLGYELPRAFGGIREVVMGI